MSHAPTVITDLSQWAELRKKIRDSAASVGFVPTMGALHAGHQSLLERCRRENQISILSIYVNPTQFDNKNDLNRYPKTLERDRELAGLAGIDYILLPTYSQIYPDDYRYKVTEGDLSKKLCGAHRPGHFDGVLTVVMKLFNLVRPDRAYFGEKDFQQLDLIRGMVQAFFLGVEVVPCPTVREQDGLAMSSRNVNLPPEARALAPQFHRALRDARTSAEARARLESGGFEVDYIEDIERRRFGAVTLSGVRLIDNVER